MKFPDPRPLRVVAYRVGSLGDTLVVLPAFHLVRRAFPNAHITLLTSFPVNAKAAPMEAILKGTGLYQDTLRYPTFVRDFRELARLSRALRAGRYDRLVYLAKPKGGVFASIRDYLFFRASGIPKVTGIPFSRRKRVCLPVAGSSLFVSETERTMQSLSALGAVDLREPQWWDMCLSESEISDGRIALAERGVTGPFLAGAVGTKNQSNDWEEPNWTELMRRITAAHPRLSLVLFGVQEERERSERLLAAWHGPKANLCGVTSPRVSAAVLRDAVLMICHDSGPMHLAATMGVPCVAIFSARGKPGEWYPRGENHTIFYRKVPCWGCGLTKCIEKKKACILGITVDEVFAAVQQRLSPLSPAAP